METVHFRLMHDSQEPGRRSVHFRAQLVQEPRRSIDVREPNVSSQIGSSRVVDAMMRDAPTP